LKGGTNIVIAKVYLDGALVEDGNSISENKIVKIGKTPLILEADDNVVKPETGGAA